MGVVEVATRAQWDDLLKTSKYVALKAQAVWCPPCKAIAPIFAKHAEEHGAENKYTFASFDIDEVPDLAQELGIRAVPAFFFFEDGDKTDSIGGANPPALKKSVLALADKAKAEGGNTLATNEDF